MIKTLAQFLRSGFLLMFLLTSCSTTGSPAQVPTSPPEEITDPIPVVATATFVPFEMIGLDIQAPLVGTTMPWVDGSVLVYVPEGAFLMGGNKNDNKEHTVNLSPFWIHQTKVTNRMYGLCVNVGVCTPPLDKQAVIDLQNQFFLDRPVIDVNWEQAQAYCSWVEGSLPTEAQWEKAARGPEGNIYPWGAAEPSCDLLNFNKCLGKISRVFDYIEGRSFYSAYDMAGNTFEWVNDRYDAYYYRNSPESNPPGPDTGTRRVVRGSNFLSKNTDVPVSLRSLAPPEDHRSDLGFRCVVEQPRVFAPYCQTSAFVPGDANVPPPSRSCDVSENFITRGCRYVNHEVVGAGELSGVTGAPVLDCAVVGGSNLISCSGPESTTGVVTAAVVCGTFSEGDHLADPECFEEYAPVPGSEVSCEIVPRSAISEDCPPGETLFDDGAGGTFCGRLRAIEEGPGEPAGGLDPVTGCFPGMDLVTGSDGMPICRATTPEGRTIECPPGTLPRPTSGETYACFDPGGTRHVTGSPCGPGEYLSDDRICVGTPPEGGLVPGNSCLEGFIFDTTLGCCQSPSGVFPGCSAGEFYDAVHGCQPIPGASGTIITAFSFAASTGACGGSIPEGGDPGGSLCGGIGGDAACNSTPGCHWDYDPAVKACVSS